MFSPMLAHSAPPTEATIRSLTGTHIFELKLDGVRGILAVNNGVVKITNRNGVDITGRYPEIAEAALAKWGTNARLILDGEVVVFHNGLPSFKHTAKRDRQQKPAVIKELSQTMPATFVAFDLLYRDDTDLRRTPWTDRHTLLDEVLGQGDHALIRPNVSSTDGMAMFNFVLEHHMEGLVAKLMTSHYQGGRQSAWVKIKPTKTASFLVTGLTQGTGSRAATFGALSLAVVREDGTLLPVGEVGTGFKAADLREVLDAYQDGGDLIVEVEYLEYTVDGSLRFPVFKGIRTDLTRSDCGEEQVTDGR